MHPAAVRRQSTLPSAASSGESDKWTALLAVVAGMLLVFVWRIQDVIPLMALLRMPTLVILGGIALYVLDAGAMARTKARLNTPAKLALFLLVLGVLSIPMSLWPGLSYSAIFNGFLRVIILMLILIGAIRSYRDVERLFTTMVGGAMMLALISLSSGVRTLDGRLYASAYYDPNDLATVLVATLPLAVYFIARRGDRILRGMGLLSTPLLAYVIIQTGSRGGFVALIASTFYMLFAFRAIPRRVRIWVMLLGGLLFVVAGSEWYWYKMKTIFNPKDDYNWAGASEAGRMEVWKRGFGYMVRRPLLGVGAAAFPVAEGELSVLARQREMIGLGMKWSNAHNAFVQIGAELGVFALLAFILMIGTGIHHAWRFGKVSEMAGGRSRDGPLPGALGQAVAGSLVGLGCGAVFLSHAYESILYVNVGMVAAITMLERAAPVRAAVTGRASYRPHPGFRPGSPALSGAQRAIPSGPPLPHRLGVRPGE